MMDNDSSVPVVIFNTNFKEIGNPVKENRKSMSELILSRCPTKKKGIVATVNKKVEHSVGYTLMKKKLADAKKISRMQSSPIDMRLLTAYRIFNKERGRYLKEFYPTMNKECSTKVIGNQWRNLKQRSRGYYLNAADIRLAGRRMNRSVGSIISGGEGEAPNRHALRFKREIPKFSAYYEYMKQWKIMDIKTKLLFAKQAKSHRHDFFKNLFDPIVMLENKANPQALMDSKDKSETSLENEILLQNEENPEILLQNEENPEILLQDEENPEILLQNEENPEILLQNEENPEILLQNEVNPEQFMNILEKPEKFMENEATHEYLMENDGKQEKLLRNEAKAEEFPGNGAEAQDLLGNTKRQQDLVFNNQLNSLILSIANDTPQSPTTVSIVPAVPTAEAYIDSIYSNFKETYSTYSFGRNLEIENLNTAAVSAKQNNLTLLQQVGTSHVKIKNLKAELNLSKMEGESLSQAHTDLISSVANTLISFK